MKVNYLITVLALFNDSRVATFSFSKAPFTPPKNPPLEIMFETPKIH